MNSEKSSNVSTESSALVPPEETIIGSSFFIDGDLVAEGDTLIEGQVEGSIRVENHTLRVGKKGGVEGEIFAKKIVVEGKVKGQIVAKETVVLRKLADIQGDILAPQVSMEEGCKFNGSVKMKTAASTNRHQI